VAQFFNEVWINTIPASLYNTGTHDADIADTLHEKRQKAGNIQSFKRSTVEKTALPFHLRAS
jgi:hypothetical protein